MNTQRLLITTLLLGLLPLACVAAPADVDDLDVTGSAPLGFVPEDPEQGGEGKIMIISVNGLPPGLLAARDLTNDMADLADTAMTASTPLTDTADGRTLLAFMARCALPSGQSLRSVDATGVAHRFPGTVGLAPEWSLGAIGTSSRRWVSACLLAHANAFGLDVTIDLQGKHPALSAPPASGMTAQEASFYGDLFGPPTMFACIGSSPSAPEGMPKRVCGRTDNCGFTITGTCGHPSQTPVCKGGQLVFDSCAAPVLPSGTVDVVEVITVYAQPGTFAQPPSCDHDASETGSPLATSCSQTVKEVCSVDPYCCETAWDQACVDLATPSIPMP
jgi:hypothetical protein